MKARHATLGVMFLAAVWLNWFGDDPSGATFVAPTERSDTPGVPARTVAAPASSPAILPLRARSELIGGADEPEQVLFDSHSWTPPPPPPAEVKVEPPPKPVAPPLPFAYMGSYTPNGSPAVFFLTSGEKVYDVHVGDTIDNTYTVDAFNNGQLVFTYKPLNQQQQLSTGGAP
jgi:hypothetical protein